MDSVKYVAVNELNNFDYHDAELKKIILKDNYMKWEVCNINATTANSQNDFVVDMCIGNAAIIFNEVTIESIVYGAYTTTDSSGNSKEYKPVTVKPEEHFDAISNIANDYCYLYAMDELVIMDDNRYRAIFHIDFNTYLTIIFTESIISWNEFDGKAWYEHEKWKNSNLTE